MFAQMSTVNGTELRKTTTSGFFVLTGLITATTGDLATLKTNADARFLLNSLTLSNVPKEGDKLNNNFPDWICVDRTVRPANATQYNIYCIFRWLGALSIRDHLSLEQITTVINPGTKKPIYNSWTDPNPAPGIPARTFIKKLAHFPLYRVIRNITYTKTVKFTARDSVLAAKKCVNDAPWMGLDAGYWMVSDIQGDTSDAGITYNYSVTFSTRDEISWAEFNILEDDTGHEVYVDPVKFNSLATKLYAPYSEDNTTCPGVVRADLYNTVNFPLVFGVGPGAPSTVDLSGIM